MKIFEARTSATSAREDDLLTVRMKIIPHILDYPEILSNTNMPQILDLCVADYKLENVG